MDISLDREKLLVIKTMAFITFKLIAQNCTNPCGHPNTSRSDGRKQE